VFFLVSNFSLPPLWQSGGHEFDPRQLHHKSFFPITYRYKNLAQEYFGKPKKQRHKAKRIHDLLEDEHGFAGGFGIVKDYAREVRYRIGRDSTNAHSLFAASLALL